MGTKYHKAYRRIGWTCHILAALFIVLKLVGTITWSWWWVLSPVWISVSLTMAHGAATGVWTELERQKEEASNAED